MQQVVQVRMERQVPGQVRMANRKEFEQTERPWRWEFQRAAECSPPLSLALKFAWI